MWEIKKDQWWPLPADDTSSCSAQWVALPVTFLAVVIASQPTERVSCTIQWRDNSQACSTEWFWGLIEEYFWPIIKSIRRKCSKRFDAAPSIEESRYPNKQIITLNSHPSLCSGPSSFQNKDFSLHSEGVGGGAEQAWASQMTPRPPPHLSVHEHVALLFRNGRLWMDCPE